MSANVDELSQILMTSSVDIRCARLQADVEKRLGRVCGHMSPDAFADLVAKVCAVKRRWDLESTRPELG